MYLFWKVGKFTWEKKSYCENIIKKCSLFLAYYFGNSKIFSYENIVFMRKFYLYFPIFIDDMSKLEWDTYLELMKINNRKICYFYYQLSLFCKLTSKDLKVIIENNFYNMI